MVFVCVPCLRPVHDGAKPRNIQSRFLPNHFHDGFRKLSKVKPFIVPLCGYCAFHEIRDGRTEPQYFIFCTCEKICGLLLRESTQSLIRLRTCSGGGFFIFWNRVQFVRNNGLMLRRIGTGDFRLGIDVLFVRLHGIAVNCGIAVDQHIIQNQFQTLCRRNVLLPMIVNQELRRIHDLGTGKTSFIHGRAELRSLCNLLNGALALHGVLRPTDCRGVEGCLRIIQQILCRLLEIGVKYRVVKLERIDAGLPDAVHVPIVNVLLRLRDIGFSRPVNFTACIGHTVKLLLRERVLTNALVPSQNRLNGFFAVCCCSLFLLAGV
ncbi:hypothetical protein SDC9_76430 [bioreactor metagenome]|uniref:Uncharacterized protein n=1 Tax=bioreactor metagenome TaxID=1076179 RepID=A0A644YPH0_9ZZZZ